MIIKLILLFVIAFIQNMAFTFVSRSRNSGDPARHFRAAIASNSIWFICNYFILFPEIMKVINDGNLLMRVVFMAVYVIATSFGSTVMMKLNLGQLRIPVLTRLFEEKEKAKVGER